jgi:hypothetical protein
MMIRHALIVLLANFLTVSANAACNSVEAQTGIQWCNDQCNVTHSNRQCDGSGYMAGHARSGDANGVRDGFANCHFGNDDSEVKQKTNVEACFIEDPKGLVRVACAVYGGCPCELTNSCPKPPTQPTRIDFNQPLLPASDNKNIVIADFLLPGKGNYQSITLNYTKDGVNVFNLSTYAVNFSLVGDKIHLKITTYDKGVDSVQRHKYSVAGTLELAP